MRSTKSISSLSLFTFFWALLLYGLLASPKTLTAGSWARNILETTSIATETSLLSVTISPAKDTSLFEATGNSGGASSILVAGNTTSKGVRRSLLAFDLAGIPANATVLTVLTFGASLKRS